MAISKIKVGTTEHELQTTIANVSGLQAQLDNKMEINPHQIELNLSGNLNGYGGYIDFHFFNSSGNPTDENGTVVSTSPDYTSRIIESSAGTLSINGVKMTSGTVAEGDSTIASGKNSHAEGNSTTASGSSSHAEGIQTTASGLASHADGWNANATGDYSHASGYSTIADDFQFVVGRCNASTTAPTGLQDTTSSAGIFIVGVGTGFTSTTRSNGFRINPAGKPYALSTMASSGADYAEYFEWMDGNPTDEDRRGRFVTLDGNKIRYATTDDDYILGVVSSEPTVVGDIHSETWRDMYLRDVFGSRIQETVEVEEFIDENGVTIPAHIEKRWVLNPDYNPEEKYVSREDRPEWDAIGIVGKLVAVDDGTCRVNGYCYPDIDGVATMSENKTAYRVIERLDDTHIRIFIK